MAKKLKWKQRNDLLAETKRYTLEWIKKKTANDFYLPRGDDKHIPALMFLFIPEQKKRKEKS